MITVADIVETLGRRRLALALRVGPTAISNAVVRGTFPASWYLVVSEMAKPTGVSCPFELFTFKTAPAVVAGPVEADAA